MALTTAIFDLGGVLVWTHWDRVTQPFGQMSGLTPEGVMEEIRTGDAYYPFMRGEFDGAEFHRRLTRKLGLELDPAKFFTIWKSIIAPNADITSLIERLRGRCRLAIGSNTDVLHHERSLEVQDALRHFNQALVSYRLGHCKPDPAFFSVGLERLSAAPGECVFIDDRAENVEAAETLGITGVQFLSTEQLESDLADMGLL